MERIEEVWEDHKKFGYPPANPEIRCFEWFVMGWDDCKREILKVLKEHPNVNEKTSLDKAFEKIEKL